MASRGAGLRAGLVGLPRKREKKRLRLRQPRQLEERQPEEGQMAHQQQVQHEQHSQQEEWRAVDTGEALLGGDEGGMFFGLEQMDGNAFLEMKKKRRRRAVEEPQEEVQQEQEEDSVVPAPLSKKKKARREKDKARREKAKEERAKERAITEQLAKQKKEVEVEDADGSWGGETARSVQLHTLLVSSLGDLHFSTPTPIQSSAIPKVLGPALTGSTASMVDVVGSAETGSGKTLAFGLPILHSLLHNWKSRGNFYKPFSLILAPTRELAMQITSVLTDVCKNFRHQRRVEIVNVIGGLSEHKQRRQLSTSGKPCHVIVATPGRLCDMLDDDSVGALQDLSCLRYLVVDEVDRMMEDGHFPELHKIFGRITDHEGLAAKGLCPIEEAKKAREGTEYIDDRDIDTNKTQSKVSHDENIEGASKEDSDVDDVEEFDLEAEPIVFEPFPSDVDIQKAKENPLCQIPLNELSGDSEDDISLENAVIVKHTPRQTMLFSATAINIHGNVKSMKKKMGKGSDKSKRKKFGELTALGLPDHLCQLLVSVGLHDTVIANVLQGVPFSEDDNKSYQKGSLVSSAITARSPLQAVENAPVLPEGLQQLEVRVATEDKDIMTYYYLLKYVGRTLIFVNSIKTARRLDGLLRALGINCRCIHAQLQQKQRIKALESFVQSPVGILVATDVAARGLDLPKIQYVVHYDVARSPQVYIHRSGRTARAGKSGVALSIVAPEDTDHHKDVCNVLQLRTLPLLKGMDLTSVPVVRDRVKLAKKIFLKSFLSSQSTKEQSWIENTAKEAGLAIDDTLMTEMNGELDSTTGARHQRDVAKEKKELERDRAALKSLLQEPYQEDMRINPRQKRSFIVVAK